MRLFSWFSKSNKARRKELSKARSKVNRKRAIAQQQELIKLTGLTCNNTNMWPMAKVRSAVIVAQRQAANKQSTVALIKPLVVKAS